jgi:DNA-directed RNA polymerase subunit RPC12/RpoP
MAQSRLPTCQKCSRELKASAIDLLPMPTGSVSVDCPYCGHTNRVLYIASLLLWVCAAILAFAVALLVDHLFPRLGAWVVITAFGGTFVLNWLFLRTYLRYSRNPFTQLRRGP